MAAQGWAAEHENECSDGKRQEEGGTVVNVDGIVSSRQSGASSQDTISSFDPLQQQQGMHGHDRWAELCSSIGPTRSYQPEKSSGVSSSCFTEGSEAITVLMPSLTNVHAEDSPVWILAKGMRGSSSSDGAISTKCILRDPSFCSPRSMGPSLRSSVGVEAEEVVIVQRDCVGADMFDDRGREVGHYPVSSVM